MLNFSKNQGKTRSFAATMLAIAWSFIGLRRKKDFDQDVGGLNPVYVLLAGVLGAALLVGGLITIVHVVVGNTDASQVQKTVQPL